ncbi:hypothetical protein ACGF8B_20335 [Streptomyces sp. NPDC047917]|uniref:hypothetical protein n=1 Tax=Streptomyces sp. NPDC047917 TaxID=3365491 RepID=UPI0037148A62
MPAAAQLLLSALAGQVPEAAAPPAPGTDVPLVPAPRTGPLTSEPPLADAIPLTSEPPLADATPLTSEPPLAVYAPLTSEPATSGGAWGTESPGV